MNCCALLWWCVPPQIVTYAIGVGLHSAIDRACLAEFLRSAWSFLDNCLAVECILGSIGTIRLRLQMNMLVDQYVRCTQPKGGTSEEETAELLNNSRLTLIHLVHLCEGDARFAQVAVLYGVPFIVECLCAWSERAAGWETVNDAGRGLVLNLSPHLKRFFTLESTPNE